MNISIAVVIFLLTVFASISLNGIMRNIAKNNRWLIDIPDKNRKFHLWGKIEKFILVIKFHIFL